MADINIGSAPRPTLTVNLVGKPLKVKPPKSALAIEMAQSAGQFKETKSQDPSEALKVMDTLYEWLGMLMPKKDVDAIKRRLRDPEDSLDIDHLVALLEKVTEYSVKANPTS